MQTMLIYLATKFVLRYFVLVLICTILPLVARGNTLPPVVAYVVGTGTYADGAVYIFFDRPISSCSQSGRLDIAAGHPALKNILTVAVIAFNSSSAVRIHPGTCAGETPVFQKDGDSYFYLTKDVPS